MLPWLLVIVLGVIVGAFFWANSPAKEYWSLSTLQSKSTLQSNHETSPAPQDETKQAIATLLSSEQRQRKELMEQLGALAAHVDDIARQHWMISRQHVLKLRDRPTRKRSRRDRKAPYRGDETLGSGRKACSWRREPHFDAWRVQLQQSNRTARHPRPTAPSLNRLIELGQFHFIQGVMSLDPRKSTIGPIGCNHFRSFDAVSGTYTTFDGRRRPCQ